jgi:hypothetical protein
LSFYFFRKEINKGDLRRGREIRVVRAFLLDRDSIANHRWDEQNIALFGEIKSIVRVNSNWISWQVKISCRIWHLKPTFLYRKARKVKQPKEIIMHKSTYDSYTRILVLHAFAHKWLWLLILLLVDSF